MLAYFYQQKSNLDFTFLKLIAPLLECDFVLN